MIAIKKSEFIEEYERNARSMPGAEAAAKAVEMAGMEWFPEEPELPERLFKGTDRLYVEQPPGSCSLRDCNAEEYREAAARWNFVTFLLGDYELHKGMETPRGGLLRAYNRRLQQEREKLQ